MNLLLLQFYFHLALLSNMLTRQPKAYLMNMARHKIRLNTPAIETKKKTHFKNKLQKFYPCNKMVINVNLDNRTNGSNKLYHCICDLSTIN